ncbi:MAG TPA: hypothetical protein VKS01_10625 [Bryobacteraceae bacterium]|nr:hypothetical protein [Bryobacteraceae bacterium]
MNPDRRNLLVCCLLLVLAAAVTWPVVELGINDDWSYARTAFDFARTGHILYHGWSSPILIPQILWGALFAKLLGASFFALRLSSMAIALLCVPALYFLARECGLDPEFAMYATLLSVLAPVFLLEAVTYMTDVQAFLPFVLCLYAGVRASRANSAAEFRRWCAVLAITGLWAGLLRQVFFAAPVLFLLVLAWWKRREIRFIWPVTASIAVLGIALATLRWYGAQPFAIPDSTPAQLAGEPARDVLQAAGITLLRYLGTSAIFLLPLLAVFVAICFERVERKLLIPAWAIAATLSWMLVRDPDRLPPWLGNIVSEDGIFSPSATALGARTPTLSPSIKILLSLAVFVGVTAVVLVLWKLRAGKADRKTRAPAIRAFLALGVPFALTSLALIAVRSYFITVFDRYLIPILPICSIPLLWFVQTRLRSRIGAAGWSVLAVFSLYAVAGTHDLFTDNRARLHTLDSLRARGIARGEILGGLEYDGWTQLDIAGHLNNSDLPKDIFREIETCSGLPLSYIWYREMAPDLTPRYFLTFSPLAEFVDSPFPPTSYSAWLPPRRRTIWIQMLPGGSSAVCHTAAK